MAATIIGSAGVDWGMTSETFGVAQAFSETKTCNTAEIVGTDGDIKGASFYGHSNNASLSFLTNAAPSTNFGVSVVFANAEAPDTYYTTSVQLAKTNTGFMTGTINAIAFPA